MAGTGTTASSASGAALKRELKRHRFSAKVKGFKKRIGP